VYTNVGYCNKKNKVTKQILIAVGIISISILLIVGFTQTQSKYDEIAEKYPEIIYYEVNPKLGKLQFYSRDENGIYFQNHKNLKDWLANKNQKLVFAMNGGMYRKDLSPQGLYIEDRIEKSEIDI